MQAQTGSPGSTGQTTSKSKIIIVVSVEVTAVEIVLVYMTSLTHIVHLPPLKTILLLIARMRLEKTTPLMTQTASLLRTARSLYAYYICTPHQTDCWSGP